MSERPKPAYYLILVQKTRSKEDFESPAIYVFTENDDAFRNAWENIEKQMDAGIVYGYRVMTGYEFLPVETAVQEKLL